jgi:hypothetical protein
MRSILILATTALVSSLVSGFIPERLIDSKEYLGKKDHHYKGKHGKK